MKELLTLKEAASLAGRTTKTIKNYIKQGKITNFFLVEGKYGQEYRINIKDIEPLVKQGKKKSRTGTALAGERADKHNISGEVDHENIARIPTLSHLGLGLLALLLGAIGSWHQRSRGRTRRR